MAEGVNRIRPREGDLSGSTCPFCAQDLSSSPLIRHYQGYFGSAYEELRNRTSATLAEIQGIHGEGPLTKFERSVRVAIQRRQFWSQFCSVTEFEIDTAKVVQDWKAARNAVVAHLDAKQNAPLERMTLSDKTRVLVTAYETHIGKLNEINQSLLEANQAIDAIKTQVARTNPSSLSANLARLVANKARYEPKLVGRCDDYMRELKEKRRSEEERGKARESLENYRETIFPKFQQDTNSYLDKFNAGFRVSSLEYANIGGGSGSTCKFNVLINNVAVPIGRAPERQDKPAFRNTLSAGDRTTLALAFFFATIDHHPGLE